MSAFILPTGLCGSVRAAERGLWRLQFCHLAFIHPPAGDLPWTHTALEESRDAGIHQLSPLSVEPNDMLRFWTGKRLKTGPVRRGVADNHCSIQPPTGCELREFKGCPRALRTETTQVEQDGVADLYQRLHSVMPG